MRVWCFLTRGSSYFDTHVWCFMLQLSVVLIATSWTRQERHALRHPDSQSSVLSADFALNLLKHNLLPPPRHQRTVTSLKVFHAADSQWHHYDDLINSLCHLVMPFVNQNCNWKAFKESKWLWKSGHAVLKKSFTFIICMYECMLYFILFMCF